MSQFSKVTNCPSCNVQWREHSGPIEVCRQLQIFKRERDAALEREARLREGLRHSLACDKPAGECPKCDDADNLLCEAERGKP